MNQTKHVLFMNINDDAGKPVLARFLNVVDDADFQRVVNEGRLDLPKGWRAAHCHDGDVSRLGKMAHIRNAPILSGDPMRELRAYWQRHVVMDDSGFLNERERRAFRAAWTLSMGWAWPQGEGFKMVTPATHDDAFLLVDKSLLSHLGKALGRDVFRLTPRGWGLARVSWNRYGDLQTPGVVDDDDEARR